MAQPDAMRRVAAAVLAALVVGGPSVIAQPARGFDAGDVGALAWLEGVWTSTNGETIIEERWTPPAGGALLGTNRTLRGERMVAFEFLRIVAREGAVYFIAQPGGRAPTEFRMTGGNATSVVFENPQHDHPKVIRYRRSGDTLTAEVEGEVDGRKVQERFTFQRMAQ